MANQRKQGIERITLTLPDEMLSRLEEQAEEQGTDRLALMREALRSYLGLPPPPAAIPSPTAKAKSKNRDKEKEKGKDRDRDRDRDKSRPKAAAGTKPPAKTAPKKASGKSRQAR